MLIKKSNYIHLIVLAEDRVLIIHAISHLRLVVDDEVARIICWFETPRDMPGDMHALLADHALAPDILAGCLATLMERQVLTDKDALAETGAVASRLANLHGRDPGEALDHLRRTDKSGADPYWSVSAKQSVTTLGEVFKHKWEALLFGDCELQMEADFFVRAAAARGVDLRIATGFSDDLRLAGERSHQAIFIGALRSRRLVAQGTAADHGGDPTAVYIAEARGVIEGLRAHSSAPILIDNLPEPTVQPMGFADKGVHSHRNRFRLLNLQLEALAAEYPDVHVIDIAAALNAAGSAHFLDDGLVGFTHFGSPGWMLQRPSNELAAVHGLFPNSEPLKALVGDHPYGREEITARAHMNALSVLTGLDRKKCVVLDLDGTLWPGVLAETGAPFAWTPEISGLYSYVGLWFGLHEALLALKRRGVLLACVSKNDEALVRELWRYPEHYPHDRLLTLDDFVTVRINWLDKATNIRSIADELGFALDAFLFVDDHPVERERVRSTLPAVEVMGDDLFALRRALLTDPRLQAASMTGESAARTALVKSKLDRDRERAGVIDGATFLASLEVVCKFHQPTDAERLNRVCELFQRTTQFNTTGRLFSLAELIDHADAGRVFIANASDRFGDYGLVAACVVEGGEIIALAMSCRVIGLGIEHNFLAHVLSVLGTDHVEVRGRIVPTARNGPARHLYGDHGFHNVDGLWRLELKALMKAC